jgi:hypothetical protein
MKLRRRIAAGIALFAVSWASLWPLVTSAHALIASDEMVLCHGAGTMVEPGEPPRPVEGAPGGDGLVHCPLCIMAFYAAHAAPPTLADPSLTRLHLSRAVERPPHLPAFHSPLPPSRAPPVAS